MLTMNSKTRLVMATFVLIVVSLFAPQCKKDKPSAPAPVDTTTIFPLAVGNHWTYNVALSTDGGPYAEQAPYDMEVLQSDTLNGGTWYSFGNASIDSLPEDFYANIAGGFHRNAETPGLYFKYPANPGETWSVPSVRSGTVISTNASVTVPTGSYLCYEYSIHFISGINDSARYYCNSEVGMVKFFMWNSNLTYRFELTAFTRAGN